MRSPTTKELSKEAMDRPNRRTIERFLKHITQWRVSPLWYGDGSIHRKKDQLANESRHKLEESEEWIALEKLEAEITERANAHDNKIKKMAQRAQAIYDTEGITPKLIKYLGQIVETLYPEATE